VTGYEALSRFSAEPWQPPDVWFGLAAEAGLGVELECFAIERALATFDFTSDAYLSVNASPDTIMADRLGEMLRGNPSRIVLEVTEHARVASYPDLHKHLAPLRAAGIRLAVDDAGAGFSGLQHILELRPEIIKLDISLTRDINTDPTKRALGTALVTFARELRAHIVAEGVETAGEFLSLRELGVDLGQGYFMARPAPWGKAELNLDLP